MRGVLAILLVGCKFSSELIPGDGADSIDDAPMVDARALDGCTTFSTIVSSCMVGAYGGPLSITGMKRYDTGSHLLSNPDGSGATTPMFFETTIDGAPITLLVVNGFRVEMSASLRVVGPRAFGVVSPAAIEIIGLLDGTGTADVGGAGARNAGACGDSAGRDGNDNNGTSGGASGGGGGAFRTAGARGGVGDNNDDQIVGGVGGVAVTTQPMQIIGGCPGGGGGDQGIVGNGRTGGDGGAAIFMTSAMSISVMGQINVGGGGGRGGGALEAGGAGGGSGGLVLLESPSVTVAGTITANGGAGGGGASDTTDGGDGQSGRPTMTAAMGGAANGNAGAGGAGGVSATNPPAQPANANQGAGGGGGGVGYVFIKAPSPNVTGTISPGLSTWFK